MRFGKAEGEGEGNGGAGHKPDVTPVPSLPTSLLLIRFEWALGGFWAELGFLRSPVNRSCGDGFPAVRLGVRLLESLGAAEVRVLDHSNAPGSDCSLRIWPPGTEGRSSGLRPGRGGSGGWC